MQRWVISLYWKFCKATEFKCLFEIDFHVKLCMYAVLLNTDYYVSSRPKSHGCLTEQIMLMSCFFLGKEKNYMYVPKIGQIKLFYSNLCFYFLTLSEPAFFWVSHEPYWLILALPFYFSPEASEELVLNITFVTIFLRIILRYIKFL